MNVTTLAARNLTRNRTRVVLTIVAVALAIVLFLGLRTVVWAWTYGKDVAAKDRVVTRHKVTFVMQLPKNYIEKVRAIPGIKESTWANWFGGKDPKDETHFFAQFAVDAASYLQVYSEMVVPPEQKEAWMHDPQGVIIGDILAKTMKLKVGDKVVLKGTIYPGDWEFHVSGIYQATAKSVDRSQLLMHWDYLNNKLPERRRDQIGWIASRIDDPRRSAELVKTIDATFDSADTQTLSMSEKLFNNSFIAMFSGILTAIQIVSFVILAIMLLILGNTIAMGVRERTYEYGVLRAIGFLPGHIASFIVGEGLFVGAIGGAVGLVFGQLMISGIGKAIEEGAMAGMFPYFRLQPLTAALGLALAAGLGAFASLVPAYRASRLHVTEALRRVE
jgi:putative ABC transport system permease protein